VGLKSKWQKDASFRQLQVFNRKDTGAQKWQLCPKNFS